MKAARFDAANRSLTVQEIPDPALGPMDVLLRVEACGICLSDVHLLDGSMPPVIPAVIPGHETAGTVVEVGEEVQGWAPGDRAVVAGGKPCGSCSSCVNGRSERCLSFQVMGFHYDGAWAELVSVPFFTLSRLPTGLSIEQAAILADAVATPYAALTERGGLRPGEAVGLWGIGGLGTHAVQLARMCGAGLVVAVDPLPAARERALRLGADVAYDPLTQDLRKEVKGITGGGLLDLALDLVGSGLVLKQCVSCLGPEGRAVMVGLSTDPLQIDSSLLFGVLRQSLLGHLGYERRHLDDLVKLLARGRLDLSGSISDVIPLDDVAHGVRRLADKEGDPVRILVRP